MVIFYYFYISVYIFIYFSVTHDEDMLCAALWLSGTVFRSLCAYITALVSCPSGDRVVQTSCCGNLSVEPVCRPSALQRLLVCSVYRPAVLRHDVWQHLSGPSGNLVLSAHKV